MTTRILAGDCRDILPTLPADSFDCVVTSPPYWGLRDYGVEGQIGLEPTMAAYLERIVGVCRELRRVLKPGGTFWLNIGDSYAGGGRGGGSPGCKSQTNIGSLVAPTPLSATGLKPKDLCMIPNRLAIALQDDGWWVRSEIIWAKPNPMPESVTDRPTCAHEKVWLLTKSERYFYDAAAIREDFADDRLGNPGSYQRTTASAKGQNNDRSDGGFLNDGGGWTAGADRGGRNARNVWTIASQPFKGSHFATMPPALAERCIRAGCPEKVCSYCGAPWLRVVDRTPIALRPNSDSIRGNSSSAHRARGNAQRGSVAVDVKTIGFEPSCSCNGDVTAGAVLDPFGGAGTAGLVADRLGRNAILIELNPNYADMTKNRIEGDAPLFSKVLS